MTPPSILTAQFDRALALHQAGHADQAAPIYEQIIALAPKHAQAPNLLGMIRLGTGQIQDGVTLLKRAARQALRMADDNAHRTRVATHIRAERGILFDNQAWLRDLERLFSEQALALTGRTAPPA